MSDQVSLTSAMRSNLIALQSTAQLLATTQQRLSTGKKVNNALDNAINFFSSQNLTNRAKDLASYKDGMSNAIQTIQAANQGVTSITALINSAKAVATSASGAITTSATSNQYQTDTLSFSSLTAGDTITIAGCTFTAVAATTAAVGSTQFRVGATDAQTAMNFVATIGVSMGAAGTWIGQVPGDGITIQSLKGNTVTLTSGTTDITTAMVTASNTISQAFTAGSGAASAYDGDAITFSNVKAGDTLSIAGCTFTAVAATTAAIGSTQFRIGTTDDQTAKNFAATIGVSMGAAGTWIGQVPGDGITIKNVSGNVVTLSSGTTDISNAMVTGSSSMNGTIIPGGTSTGSQMASLVSQYNTILDQIDNLAADSSFQGIDLLNNTSASALVVKFGGNHSLNVGGFDATSAGLGLSAPSGGWATADGIAGDLNRIDSALTTLQTQASSLSNYLGIIQTRQDFSTNLGNVLQAGSDNLTLADTNEEGANMLMLQTRQSLGITALSLSSQAAQSVLRLFG